MFRFIILIQLLVFSVSCILDHDTDPTVKWMNAFRLGSSATVEMQEDPFEKNVCGENAFDVARKINDLTALRILIEKYPGQHQ